VPPLETMDLHDVACLYEPAALGQDAYNRGRYLGPVQVQCRVTWQRRQAVNAQGQTIALDATAVLDRDPAEGSLLVLTEMGALPEPTDTAGWAGLDVLRVSTYTGAADLKNRFYRRSVGLVRVNSQAPVTTS
jgi:hypothetical protein